MKDFLKSVLFVCFLICFLFCFCLDYVAIDLSLKTTQSQHSLPSWEVIVNGNFIHFERVKDGHNVSTTHNLLFNEANVLAGTNKITSFQECYGQNGLGEQVLIGATILIQ